MSKSEKLKDKSIELIENISNALEDGDEKLAREMMEKFIENESLLDKEMQESHPKYFT